MLNPCTLYIVRHGQTEWNKLNKLQGHLDSPLTESGIRQAAARSETFKDTAIANLAWIKLESDGVEFEITTTEGITTND